MSELVVDQIDKVEVRHAIVKSLFALHAVFATHEGVLLVTDDAVEHSKLLESEKQLEAVGAVAHVLEVAEQRDRLLLAVDGLVEHHADVAAA